MRRQTEDLDQEKEGNILSWLTINNTKMKTLEQVWRSPVILQTLLNIQKEHFSSLQNEPELTVTGVFQTIQVYINEYLGKRLNRKLKTSILSPASILRLCQLILYISVYSTNKKKFIEDILSLPTVTQTYLMNVIGDLEQSIYQMDLTEILQKVESLEVENERLQNEIGDRNYQLQFLTQEHRVTKLDLQTAYSQLQVLKKQKANLFKQFQINQIEEYAQIYRQLHKQYTQTFNCLIKSEKRQRLLSTDVTNSKLKIIQDNKLISQLYEEIDSLKAICKNLRGYSGQSFLEDQPFSPQSQNILKQNNRLGNSIYGHSPIKQSNGKASQKLFTQTNSQLEQQIYDLKNEIKQLNYRVQNYYEIIQSQKQVILTYKNDISQLKKCNQIRKWKLQELQSIHSDLSKLVLNK